MRDDPTPELRLAACLREEAANFVHTGFLMQDSTEFWTTIFHRYYGTGPTGDADPRWNELMVELKGRQVLRQLQGRPSRKDSARDA